MNIISFLKDKGVILGANVIIYLIIVGVMIPADISSVIIVLVGCIWFIPLISYMLLDYMKWKKYLNNIEKILEGLDKKYLLPEVIEDAEFITGERINEILKVLSRDMHENVKCYRTIQEEYREYIETWVHEIKTPISSTRLLIENNNNEITRKIDKQVDKIENFVEQVLYYSRSDEVGKDFIIKEVSLEEIVRKVVKRNFRDFINKGIKLQLEAIDETVFCDTKWIEFILNQILGNAIKYSKEKDSIIKIEAKKLNNSVVLTIEDNGFGIIDRDLNKVFEKGFTGENGRKFGKSTGMGLYLCKKLCVKLGLNISIESKLQEGTRVSIIFPNYKLI